MQRTALHGRLLQAERREQLGSPATGAEHDALGADPATIDAARHATNRVERGNHFNNAWWYDPICLGAYPEDGLEAFGADMPDFPDGDLADMCQPIDFLGLNIYQGGRLRLKPDGTPEFVEPGVGSPRTDFDWPVVPEALRWSPFFVHERYKLPIYITENGLASMDWVSRDGRVHDANRIDFTARYLEQLSLAIQDGADVRGYFHWSILDNFEWGAGFSKRFGLVHVDYETLKRTVKDSGHWYREVIRTNGAILQETEAAVS